jgi:hypothetical protein
LCLYYCIVVVSATPPGPRGPSRTRSSSTGRPDPGRGVRDACTDQRIADPPKFGQPRPTPGGRIEPATPRLNGKVERSHRIDQEEFYRMLHGVVIDDAGLLDVRL